MNLLIQLKKQLLTTHVVPKIQQLSLEKFKIPEIIDPIKPGRAAANFPASFPSRRANAFNWFLSQVTTLLLSLGGLLPPPEPLEIYLEHF